MKFIGSLFGYVLYFCYKLMFNNFTLALVLFTIFTRIIMFPITVKQQKSTAKQQRIQPKINEIQERYKNDKDKMNDELMKLYQRENYSPTSGCLPMLIQFPILFGLYYAIRMPLSCTFHLANVNEILAKLNIAVSRPYAEIELIDKIRNLNFASGDWMIMKNTLSSGAIADISTIRDISGSFKFLGMDMLATPQFWNINIIITILILVTQIGSMWLTNKITGMDKSAAKGCANPIFLSIFFGFFSSYLSLQVPSALGFYWILGSVISPFQSWIVQKFYSANILNSKSEAARLARLRLEEAEIIEETALKKGKKVFLPVEPTEKEKSTENEQNVSKKKKKNNNNNSKNSSDYQGKKKN